MIFFMVMPMPTTSITCSPSYILIYSYVFPNVEIINENRNMLIGCYNTENIRQSDEDMQQQKMLLK